MTADELGYSSIADIAPRLQAGEVSPVELTQACLDRIARYDSDINAFITVLADEALAEAQQAELEIRQGRYRGPLHGIPIAHKDLIYTRGVRTTAGSKVLSDFVPEYDATVAARLRAAGTVLLGKLNMHEFAAGGTSENPYYGPVHNPWRLDHHPGGSSGGSSAALASGMCLAATGSDTAGSIRLPSHCAGTSGIKPTYGRVSAFGVVPLSWSLDNVGPMTRDARDAAIVLNAIAGYDARDFASVDRPVDDYTADLERELAGLRIGIPRTYFSEMMHPDVERAWRASIDTLVSLGAVPVEVEFNQLEDSKAIGERIVRAEMTSFHKEWYARTPDLYSSDFREDFDQMKDLSALDYISAQRARDRIRTDLLAALDRADVLVTPVMPTTAWRIGAEGPDDPAPGQPEMVRFTYPLNLSGFPGLTVPCGFDPLGLPIGVQIAGKPWQEGLLLRVGHQFQQATDWHLRRPVAVPFKGSDDGAATSTGDRGGATVRPA